MYQDPVSPPAVWTTPETTILGWIFQEADVERQLGVQSLIGD